MKEYMLAFGNAFADQHCYPAAMQVGGSSTEQRRLPKQLPLGGCAWGRRCRVSQPGAARSRPCGWLSHRWKRMSHLVYVPCGVQQVGLHGSRPRSILAARRE